MCPVFLPSIIEVFCNKGVVGKVRVSFSNHEPSSPVISSIAEYRPKIGSEHYTPLCATVFPA